MFLKVFLYIVYLYTYKAQNKNEDNCLFVHEFKSIFMSNWSIKPIIFLGLPTLSARPVLLFLTLPSTCLSKGLTSRARHYRAWTCRSQRRELFLLHGQIFLGKNYDDIFSDNDLKLLKTWLWHMYWSCMSH